MADVLVVRDRLLTLRPADGLAEEEIADFPMGRALKCTLVRARSDRNLRHYYACLTQLAKALGLPNKDALHEMLKLECGLVTPIRTMAGEIKLVPASVAMDKLNETDFRRFKRQAFEAIHTNFGVDPDTLGAQGSELLGDAFEAPRRSNDGGARADEANGALGASSARGHSGSGE